MPATIDYKEVLQEVKERTCHYDTQPYLQAYTNSFTYTIHNKLKDKDFLVKVEGVRDTAQKTKTELHITVRFQADHCDILHNSQMFCKVKSKKLANFIDNLITAEYRHVFNLVTLGE